MSSRRILKAMSQQLLIALIQILDIGLVDGIRTLLLTLLFMKLEMVFHFPAK